MRHSKPLVRAALAVTALSTTVLAVPTADAAGSSSTTLHRVATWFLNDAKGSKVAIEHTGGHNATIDKKYPLVTFTGSTGVLFTEHGLLDVAPSSALSPGSKDFEVGITVRTKDTEANVFQAGTTTNGIGGDYFIKLEIAGAHKAKLAGVARCELTGKSGSSFVHVILVGKESIADGTAHRMACIKRAHSAELLVDGAVVTTRNLTLGTIDVSHKMWTIGGKHTADTGPGDMLNGYLTNAFIDIAR